MAYFMTNGMTVRIDRAGRIVLPKPLRDRLALRSGTELEIHESAEGILLKPLAASRPWCGRVAS